MKTDMSPQAITARLRQTSELRRLCIALAGKRLRAEKQLRASRAARVPARCSSLTRETPSRRP